MSLSTFIHSDWATKKRKFVKWWHRNDWVKAHTPHLLTRVKAEWYYLIHQSDCIVVDGWLLKFYETDESYMNWGDDINVYVIEKLTQKKVIPAKKLLFGFIHRKYCIIGSLLPKCMNRNTIIWGSGCLNFEQKVKWNNRSKKVHAVRGPLTRNFLLKQRVECPEIYGDPALILPLVYQPSDKTKKYPITIIPHHKDWDDKNALMMYVQKYIPDAHIINMANYAQWTDVIDEIVQSEVVFSSSLHGLIVSDAYGVPNAFAEFNHHHAKYDKYNDYYLSLEKIASRTYQPTSPLSGSDMLRQAEVIKKTYRSLHFDLTPLINACPLELKIKEA